MRYAFRKPEERGCVPSAAVKSSIPNGGQDTQKGAVQEKGRKGKGRKEKNKEVKKREVKKKEKKGK